MCAASSINLFSKHLGDLRDKGRYRSLVLPHGVDLSSNDYLGIAGDGLLRDVAVAYLQQGGDIGAGGSRLLRGHCAEHAALEDYAAEFFAAPRALYLSSGYQANVTLFQTLCGRHDVIIFDEFVHASAREGIQNSHAARIKVQHNDAGAFEDACKKAQQNCKGRIWIAVESLYSMDGDVAPLRELMEIARRYDAMLVVDEAHASGALGAGGRGLAYEHYAGYVDPAIKSQDDDVWDNLITLHTCGKAIGVAGAILCASDEVVEMMINAARGFIYSTAPMPMQAHLVQQSLRIIDGDEGTRRREKLAALSGKAQQFFGGSGSCIVPIMIGNDVRAVEVAERLQESGWDIRAIRPPTVPEGTARLRLSLSAALDEGQLEAFATDFVGVKGLV
ncbi:MAG: 8-amino-7-oxononanoate synthase [Alphaproteobacteria bacterium]